MIDKTNEIVYQINEDLLLYQKETEGGVEYKLFNKKDKRHSESGLVPWDILEEIPIQNVMACARVHIIADFGLDVKRIQRVSLLMLEPFRESGIHTRTVWEPETLPKRDIRFINSQYQDLFMVPDGSYIQIEYPDETVIKRCEFIDPYHTQIGGNVFHICEFAERMERIGAGYYPEPEITSGEAAWKIGNNKYLAIQVCDVGYDYSLYDEKIQGLDGGVLENPKLTMLEAREEILQLLNLKARELRFMDYEQIMDLC